MSREEYVRRATQNRVDKNTWSVTERQADDGHPRPRCSSAVARRRRTLNAVLRAMCRRRLIDHNPLDRVEWTLPTRNIAIDISTVPSYSDVIQIVDTSLG